MKLLCPSLFDLSLYGGGQGWRKIAEGAYGVVYEVDSGMAEPKTVAIKQMQLPQSIFDRCVLHDIFTEITCLEESPFWLRESERFDTWLGKNG